MAASPKKGGATTDDIMAAASMMPLLMLSKREPVNAALGLTTDKLGVVLLHKKMKPKKVLADLKAEAKKVQLNMRPLRCGSARTRSIRRSTPRWCGSASTRKRRPNLRTDRARRRHDPGRSCGAGRHRTGERHL